MRLITDLELTRLSPDLYSYLGSPASEERQGAVRGLGRLHDRSARDLIQLLQHDSVQEVRQAANLALEQLEGKSPARSHPPSYLRPPDNGASALRWSSDSGEASTPVTGGWQEALRTHFAIPTPPGEEESPGDTGTKESVEKSE
jgi:HEAT repeat protein